jgi:hypothetical protein
MKQWVIGAGIAVVAVGLVLGGAAYAATSAAGFETAGVAAASAYRFMGSRMGPAQQRAGGRMGFGGQLHEYMLQAVADSFGLPAADLEASLAEGKTLVEVGEAQGVAEADLEGLLGVAWSNALAAAVEDGALSQEQAEWMQEHPALVRMFAAGRMREFSGSGWQRGPMGSGFPGQW